MLGVLTRGGLDNGRGLARGGVFRHKHELESGRTSAISQQIIGFAPDGSVVNYHNPEVRETHQLTWTQIVSASSKVISLLRISPVMSGTSAPRCTASRAFNLISV